MEMFGNAIGMVTDLNRDFFMLSWSDGAFLSHSGRCHSTIAGQEALLRLMKAIRQGI